MDLLCRRPATFMPDHAADCMHFQHVYSVQRLFTKLFEIMKSITKVLTKAW